MPHYSIIRSLCAPCQESYETSLVIPVCPNGCRDLILSDVLARADVVGTCLEWQRGRSARGYGKICLFGKHWRVHRLIWMLLHGSIPDTFQIAHRCDNPPCVLDGHLFLATNKENAEDMVAKGRSLRGDQSPSRLYPESRPRGDNHPMHIHPEYVARGDKHGSRLHPERMPRGEQHGCAKLTNAQVTTIRMLYAEGGISQSALGQQFGITQPTVGKIIRRDTWQNIE